MRKKKEKKIINKKEKKKDLANILTKNYCFHIPNKIRFLSSKIMEKSILPLIYIFIYFLAKFYLIPICIGEFRRNIWKR